MGNGETDPEAAGQDLDVSNWERSWSEYIEKQRLAASLDTVERPVTTIGDIYEELILSRGDQSDNSYDS